MQIHLGNPALIHWGGLKAGRGGCDPAGAMGLCVMGAAGSIGGLLEGWWQVAAPGEWHSPLTVPAAGLPSSLC